MSIKLQKYESKPVPYELIFVDGEKLEEIGRYLRADTYMISRTVDGVGPHDNRVTFLMKSGVRIPVTIGGYLVRNLSDTDNFPEWDCWSAKRVEEVLTPVSDLLEYHIHPPYDH